MIDIVIVFLAFCFSRKKEKKNSPYVALPVFALVSSLNKEQNVITVKKEKKMRSQ